MLQWACVTSLRNHSTASVHTESLIALGASTVSMHIQKCVLDAGSSGHYWTANRYIFNMVVDESSLNVGLDAQQFYHCLFAERNSPISFMRRCDQYPETLPSYSRGDNQLRLRPQIDFIGFTVPCYTGATVQIIERPMGLLVRTRRPSSKEYT